MRDKNRRLTDFEVKEIVEGRIIHGKTMRELSIEHGLSHNGPPRVMKSERAKEFIQIAHNKILYALEPATDAIIDRVKDFKDRVPMTERQENIAFQACVKVAESAGVLAGKQSNSTTNIYNNNTTNISGSVLNIIGDTLKKQLTEVKPYEEVDYGKLG